MEKPVVLVVVVVLNVEHKAETSMVEWCNYCDAPCLSPEEIKARHLDDNEWVHHCSCV